MAGHQEKPSAADLKEPDSDPQDNYIREERMMQIGRHAFDTEHHTYIMGILNVTPDSFSDGGRWNTLDHALEHTESMIQEGADLIDIGGESARPGYTKISDEEEIHRVVPVIQAIRKRFDIPISVDTYKSQVAEAALEAGADLINDIWGLKYDPRMASVIAASGAACCLMHNRKNGQYSSFASDLKQDLLESVRLAETAGISRDKIILDPGIGFAKDYEQNLETMRILPELCRLPYPMLLGTSRKSMIGNCLHLPTEERLEGTLATTVLAVQAGCGFVRVHDIQANQRAIQMTEAILKRGVQKE